MRKLVIGILAHVDAGKTTLSEAMLYISGKIRRMGRVDKRDSYLDTNELERARGITIFSKQAVFEVDGTEITLLDTPGHVDFSAEMERTLQVLDYAILVISGADGVQGHTQTLWRLLDVYKIPVFLFVNKMDQIGTDKEKLLTELKKFLDDGCIEFGNDDEEDFYDQLAMCDEAIMESYLETGHIDTSQIARLIKKRKVFPCFFGSALKLEGVETFLTSIVKYTQTPAYPEEFGAKIFKISRDEQGNRLTHMKITGGKLKVRDALTNGKWEEKVNQIRIYSGDKYEVVDEVEAGAVCAVTGLSEIRPGEGLGIEHASRTPLLEPVLTYQIVLPEGCDPRAMLPKLREIEEEEPELRIVWDEELQEIQAQIMGEVQIEILQSIIKESFDIDVTFDSGRVLYKETIGNTVEGVGHFEPLRHYAEVHLLLEPGERGSGLQFALNCSEDVLEKNWQNLILTHLEEKVHKGVLTGSPITDIKITLVSGRAHKQHTQGGDFREATYRAVRQGLMQAESILLEPYYTFRLEIPEKMVGRAMTDIEQMHGTYQILEAKDGWVVLGGSAPVVNMRNYHSKVAAYTKGQGRLFCSLKGYEPCHNSSEVIKSIGYDPEKDAENPTGSIFCKNGAGFSVSWDKVIDHMHVESYLEQRKKESVEEAVANKPRAREEKWISLEEIDEIINRTYYANQGKKSSWKKRKSARESYYRPRTISSTIIQKEEPKEEYLLVDGYNVIFAWPELKEIAYENMDAARVKLVESLSNYQGIRKCKIIVVFDAYRVKGHREEVLTHNNIYIVYTKEAQTADHYIEKFVHDHHKKYHITVATSDALEQIIIRGKGAALLSARELIEEIQRASEGAMQAYQAKHKTKPNYLIDELSAETKKNISEYMRNENEKE
ncbi:MAG: GTP-binding protein [Clostridiales bacterium]|nr:GTP-binding protein [Clostridiales bacterium]